MSLASSSAVRTATFASSGTSAIGDRLEAARAAIEGRFLEAGDVLSRALDGVAALVSALDRMGQNLDADTARKTTAELAKAADTLRGLPRSLDARRGQVGDLVKVGDVLTTCIEEMRQHLAYLRVFAINIKITSGGIVAAGPEFAIFAQEICDVIELGRTQLDTFRGDLLTLDGALRAALVHEDGLARHCADLLPAVPDALIGSANAIAAHHGKIAEVAVSVAALARDVQKKVGGGLAALQIGDITRQRIEHVQAGLALLDAKTPGLTAEQGERLEAFIHRLLAAQLAATAADFHRDVSRIAANVAGMAADAGEMLRLRDLAYGQSQGAEGGFLRGLENHVGQALGLVADIDAGEQAARDVSRSAAEAAHDLTDQIGGIQTMRADVQMMALNTTLKCSRIGETGKPLAVIAVELRQQAIHLEKSAARTLDSLNALSVAAAASDPRASVEGGGEAAAAAGVLSDAAARIHRAGDGAESDLAEAARQGAEVVDMLQRAAGRFDFQRQIGSVLDEAADALWAQAGDDDIATDDIGPTLRPMMDRLFKTYTMAQERDVHRAMIETLGEAASEAPAAEDPDDVLF
uniref:Methyl-accepting chemotaxis sensory transducer n=1 Tax=Caulobacter sp. (strain K31) TaxID=366602 RepID=B0T7L4_CAUSK